MSPLCGVSAASVLPGFASTELGDSREGEGRYHPTSRQSTRGASLVSFHRLWGLGSRACQPPGKTDNSPQTAWWIPPEAWMGRLPGCGRRFLPRGVGGAPAKGMGGAPSRGLGRS